MANTRDETERHVAEIVELSNEEIEHVLGGGWLVIASDPGVGEGSVIVSDPGFGITKSG